MPVLPGEPVFTAYRSEDLAEVLEFVGACNRPPYFDNFHPGDIAHWMSNTFHGRNLSQHFGLFRDRARDNKIAAFNIISPVEKPAFDLIVDPRYRGGPLELALLKLSEKELLGRLAAAGIADKKPVTTVSNRDKGRQLFLEEMGYRRQDGHLELLNARALTGPVPVPELPPGFSIRSAAGESEVAGLIKVHSAAFNSKWTESGYLEVMRTPGYAAERELLVVAPDGTFAAFLIYWPDPVSRSGLFEPVGCHPDFQRQGLTRALMYSAMGRMQAAGMQTALVLYQADNAAGKALYTAAGFRPVQEIYQYHFTG